jgi:serine/threonine protein kinase
METSRAKADFESEVKLISNVHHRNLVRLLGCSRKGSEFLLVYEYMANGSLDKFLYGILHKPMNLSIFLVLSFLRFSYHF